MVPTSGLPPRTTNLSIPTKVETPADPEGPGAQVGCGEQKGEGRSDEKAGVTGTGHDLLHDRIDGRETERGPKRANRASKALEGVTAKGYFLRQGGKNKVRGVGK
jgi:hypothetical protein